MPGGVQTTVSVSVAALAGGDGYDELFQRGDGAMYRAKLAGRNRVQEGTWGAEGESRANRSLGHVTLDQA